MNIFLQLSQNRKSFRFLVLAGALVMMSSCGLLGKRVQPNDRDILSKSGMALMDNAKETTTMNHMFNAREGSIGGFGGAGGGCGCN